MMIRCAAKTKETEDAKLMELFRDGKHAGSAVQVAFEVPKDPNVSTGSRAEQHGVCTICAGDAVAIFVAKRSKSKRDHLATRLAEEFGVTAKAVRDIWNLRTWRTVTAQYWSPADAEKFLNRRLCPSCCNCGFTSIQQACSNCRGKFPVVKGVKKAAKHHTQLPPKRQYNDATDIAKTLHAPTKPLQPRNQNTGTVAAATSLIEYCSIAQTGRGKWVPFPLLQGGEHLAGSEHVSQQDTYQHQHQVQDQAAQHQHGLQQQQRAYLNKWESTRDAAIYCNELSCDTPFDVLPYAAPQDNKDNEAATEMAPLAHHNLSHQRRRSNGEGEWIFDVAVVRDFEECFDEWEAIAETLRLKCVSYT
eukprot:CAMPEP_0179437354 /NCGR_PEP_ID=MMETSP0799-20121207/21260_1 /TAXON_ID=46947 /ORGANISM="Geminigera cryophila, Strain CCMP2564" /LENGTH=359 /DNA_ID=CAMNT_0021218233 /DNA_START=45 /DNA_END=1124 /DNA_ORIENTATION=+